MKPISRFVMAAFAATALTPAAALAQDSSTRNIGYLVNNNSGVVMSGFGQCWNTNDADSPNIEGPCNPRPLAAAPARAPVVVAAAPAAAPVPAPLPVSVRTSQKFSLSGDALFAFDKAVLKPEGKAMLDDLVAKLDGASYDTIMAIGHTDRFGTNAYNQKLSERRAHAVKDHMVGKNVQAARIDAEGKGETRPVTKADDCKGGATAKVIACLQPDRRVDVEITGTKIVSSSR